MGGLGYRENHMHPSCREATLQAGERQCDTFTAHMIKVEQRLNATGYLNIIENQVHPFMAVVYPSVKGFFSAG